MLQSHGICGDFTLNIYQRMSPDALRGLHPIKQALVNYRSRVAILIFSSLCAALSEGVTMGALGIAVSSLTSDKLLFVDSLPPELKNVVTQVIGSFSADFFFVSLVIVAILSQALKSGMLFISEWAQISIGYSLRAMLQKKMTNFIMDMSYGNIITYPSGTLEKTIDQSKLVLDITTQMGSVIRAIFMGLTYSVILVTLSFFFSIITFAFVLVLWFSLSAIIARIRGLARAAASNEVALGRWTIEYLNAPRLLRLFDSTATARNSINKTWKDYLTPEKRIDLINASVPKVLELVTVVAAGVFLIGTFIWSPHARGELIATLFVYVLVFFRLRPVLKSFSDLRLKWARIVPRLEIIGKLFSIRDDDSGGQNKAISHFSNLIEFRQVSFDYPGTQKSVLRNLSFSISKGDVTAIVGPSGSGKSTIINLLMALYGPKSGEIYVDGVDLCALSISDWRRLIGIVDQDVFLLNTTVAENIKFARDDASQLDVVAAAKKAHAHEFIEELEEGYETNAGDRSVKLSGGQKQRITLARALLRKPSILILDEATSALDTDSEKLIQETLREMRGEITTIIIAHRLSTVMNADKLLVIQDGEIVEQGSPTQLIKQEAGYFSRLWTAQSS